jgi:hypothetical protein
LDEQRQRGPDNQGSVAKNILATISSSEVGCATSISGVVRDFLQHYLSRSLRPAPEKANARINPPRAESIQFTLQGTA